MTSEGQILVSLCVGGAFMSIWGLIMIRRRTYRQVAGGIALVFSGVALVASFLIHPTLPLPPVTTLLVASPCAFGLLMWAIYRFEQNSRMDRVIIAGSGIALALALLHVYLP